jgi:putative endonuclease
VTPSPARKPWWRRWFGSRSERAAVRYLKHQGFTIVRRNYRCPHGEIDIVAVEGGTIVFVEVRSTGTEDAERTAASVDDVKQQRLTRLALYFLQQHRLLDRAARFDVVVVTWPADRREPLILHHRQAFEATGRFQMYN